ncbi:unnamed protein product [Orchesella dallaii]|uniref:Protein roadkill n=1 Tax=Orchesella dallaii TaxID=48710 RepID=A0ABP1QY57_9HEXA
MEYRLNPFIRRNPELDDAAPQPRWFVRPLRQESGSQPAPQEERESPPQQPRESTPEEENESTSEEPTEVAGIVESCATTKIDYEEFTFLWNLTDYAAMTTLPIIKSPVFPGGPESNHSWQLRIYPNNLDRETDQYYFALHLTLVAFGDGDDSPTRKIRARFQFNLLGPDVESGVECAIKGADFKKNSTFGFNRIILSSDVLDGPRPLLHGESGSLQIHLRVWIEKGVKNEGPQSKHSDGARAARKDERKDLLAFEMGSLFKAILATDVTDIEIRTEKATFKAHKAILAARSKVFAAMLDVPKDKEPLEEIFIDGFDNAVVENMLEYIYSSDIKLPEGKTDEMLQIAEKYELDELKKACETELTEKITVDNALDTLFLADKNNANFLKSHVIDVINWNKETLTQSHSLKDFLNAHPTLAMELFVADTGEKLNPAIFHAGPTGKK